MSTQEASGWLPVSDLEIGFNENKLPATDDLTGKEFVFSLEKDRALKYIFQDGKNLTWETVNIPEKEESGKEIYEAMCIAPDLYMVDYVKNKSPRESVTIVLDLKRKKAMVVSATVPTRRQANRSFLDRMSQGLDLSPITYEILQADINNPPKSKPALLFTRTEDLIGKRVQYTYSRRHVYEHLYLNHRFYAWQCLKGPEKGTADADVCDYFKIVPEIYLFIWREKVVPTIGIALINFKEMRSNGKIFGLDIPTGKAVNFTMGAYAQIVSEVRH